MEHQDHYLAYIQISKPIRPQRITCTMTMMTSTPPLFNLQPSTENGMSENAPGCSIFDVLTSDDNEEFGNSHFNHSNEDDTLSVDLNVEKELNKHFGLIVTPTDSTHSAPHCTASTASMSSTAASAGTTSTDSKSSTLNTSTDSTTYEVIPLDPNICFDPFWYRCVSFREFENKPRWPVFFPCMG